MNKKAMSNFKINLNEIDNKEIEKQEISIKIENQNCNKTIIKEAMDSLFELSKIQTTRFIENISTNEEPENNETRKEEERG